MTDPQNTRDISNTPVLRFAPPLEVKLAGGGEGLIEGIASPFGGDPDTFGDVIAPGAYSATIAEHKASGIALPMLWSHDLSQPVGRWLELREEPAGLYVKGKLNLATTAGRDAFAHLEERDVTGLSIGFRLPDDGYRYQKDGSRLLLRIDLVEVSLVVVPAARAARVVQVKSFDDVQSQREFEQWLRDGGMPRAAAKTVAARGWGRISGEDDERDAVELLRKMDKALEEIRSIEIHPHYYR